MLFSFSKLNRTLVALSSISAHRASVDMIVAVAVTASDPWVHVAGGHVEDDGIVGGRRSGVPLPLTRS